ncbi:uncharacterized protein PAC_00999 [Phialocephala subalpina]|uniref:BTB domain-containing protein n=1 Tax=Phialocephala subalpina TaxID=576137 RepID=A0A1L7WEE1_9HELO|nr:uncharacterized protein PAC_00999 [Phialocephala subalpina]
MESSAESTLSPSWSDTPAKASIITRPLSGSTKHKQATLVNTSQLVTLFNGDSTEKFVVHKDFACHYSPVLRAAFNSNFLEGQTQEYQLQGTTEDAIRQVVNWFYTQKLDIRQLGPEGNIKKGQVDTDLKRKEDATLVELWVLADKLLVPKLQNAIVEEMQRIRLQIHHLPSGCYMVAYEKTQDGSPLRKFLVDGCAGSSVPQGLLKGLTNALPKDMLMDLFLAAKAAIVNSARKEMRPEQDMARYKVLED